MNYVFLMVTFWNMKKMTEDQPQRDPFVLAHLCNLYGTASQQLTNLKNKKILKILKPTVLEMAWYAVTLH